MRIACDYAGVTDRDAAADGARLPSGSVVRATGKSGSGSANRDCGAAGTSDTGLRTCFTGSGKTAGSTADVGHDAARAYRAVVRTISSLELPHFGATRLANCDISRGRRASGNDGACCARVARKGLPLTAGIFALSALAIAVFPFAPRWSAENLELTVLDVGQGDSLFVVSPHGKTMLIDGGGAFGGFPGREEHNGIDPGEEAVSPFLWSRGFQKLDVLALTHAHQDHVGRLTAILENFRVGTLWIGREVQSSALTNFEKLAHEKKIRIIHEIRGSPFSWDGIETQVLWPEIAPEEVGTAPKNNDSLVLRLK